MTTRPTFNTAALGGGDPDGRPIDAREGSDAASEFRSPWAPPLTDQVVSPAETTGPSAAPQGPPPASPPSAPDHMYGQPRYDEAPNGLPYSGATGPIPVGPATGGFALSTPGGSDGSPAPGANPPTGPGANPPTGPGSGSPWGPGPWSSGHGQQSGQPSGQQPGQSWAAPGAPQSGGLYGAPSGGGTGGPGGPYAGPGRSEPRGGRKRLVAAAVALALVSGGIGGGVGALVADNGNSTSQVTTDAGLTRSTDNTPVSPAADGTVSKAAQVILPSVVTISEVSANEAGTGSGVIIREDGYILTNNHVVSGAASGGTITVTLQDGDEVDAEVWATDPSSDLAIVKIDRTGLTAATFGDSDALQIGELVVAVGSPLGLNGTVTSGIVSAVHRPVLTGDSQVQDQNAVLDAIQTDTAINPGNSGGPLVNSKGQIVGINSAIATVGGGGYGQEQQSGNIGVGFAIASNYAQKIAEQLIADRKAVHPYLGVTATNAGGNQTTGGGEGAQIRSLVSGGPAEQGGLQVGDVITKIGDRAIPDTDALKAAVRSHEIGETITVTFVRDGQTQTAQIKLAQQP